MASTAPPEVAGAAQRVGRYRWVICGLLFAATAINYVDRQMIGVLKPTLQEEFGWTEVDFAAIVFWFQVAYALGYISFGRVVDRVRSEEHTSELQSLMRISYAVYGLKKKKR